MGIMKRLATATMLGGRGGGRAIGDGFHVHFDMFFDRPGLLAKMAKQRQSILAKTGYWTMNRMRWSIAVRSQKEDRRKAKLRAMGLHSAARRIGAGKPPRRRSGLLHQKIFFGHDSHRDSVVVGPLAFKGGGSVTVPKLLNEGGTQSVVVPNAQQVGGKTVYLPGGRRVIGKYLPRPFAGEGTPAYEAGLKRFIELTGNTPLS